MDRLSTLRGSSSWHWVWRRGWIVVLTTMLSAGAAVAVAGHATTTYSARSVVVVSSGVSEVGPGSANDAGALAVTFAGLIPEDGTLRQALGVFLGLPADRVGEDLSVTVESGTALMDVVFTASSAATALAGAREVAQLLAGSVTPAIPRGAIQVVSLADAVTVQGSAPMRAGILGALLGLALGAVLVLVWERVDGRVDTPEDLADRVDFPVWDTRTMSDDMWEAMARRCRAVAGDPSKAIVVAAPPGAQDNARQVAERVPVEARVVSGAAVGAEADREIPIVVVVPAGSRLKAVGALLRTMAELGLGPTWGLIAPRRPPRTTEHGAGVSERVHNREPLTTPATTTALWRLDPVGPGRQAARRRLPQVAGPGSSSER